MRHFTIRSLQAVNVDWYELRVNDQSPWSDFRKLCIRNGKKSVIEGLTRLLEAASDGKLLANSQMGKIRGTQLAIFELKKGSGFRAYVWKKDATIWVFLLGGKKATQSADIRDAKWLVESYLGQQGENL